jgi:tRNA pseudouridine38-40 synthase
MPTFRLTLEYDGAGFSGWQVQSQGQRTVQGTLTSALERVTGAPARVTGAGRTDAGVHAEGQVASVTVDTELSAEQLGRALNGVLPDHVAVVACAEAPADFHARYGARSKLYRYAIWNGPVASPLRRARRHRVVPPLDLDAMRKAAADLLGTHDFAAFQAAGSEVESTVRTLTRLDVTGVPRGEIDLWVEGDGFLRHMVRNLAGTLIEVGIGRREAADVARVLGSGDRSQAGPTAPASGLTLVRVEYDEG